MERAQRIEGESPGTPKIGASVFGQTSDAERRADGSDAGATGVSPYRQNPLRRHAIRGLQVELSLVFSNPRRQHPVKGGTGFFCQNPGEFLRGRQVDIRLEEPGARKLKFTESPDFETMAGSHSGYPRRYRLIVLGLEVDGPILPGDHRLRYLSILLSLK
jgi:hypothetical protein